MGGVEAAAAAQMNQVIMCTLTGVTVRAYNVTLQQRKQRVCPSTAALLYPCKAQC